MDYLLKMKLQTKYSYIKLIVHAFKRNMNDIITLNQILQINPDSHHD